MKNAYVATFKDGTTAEIKTARKCNFAYKITKHDGSIVTGFSINEKAAMQQINQCYPSVPKHDHSKAAEEFRKEINQKLANCTIEIVSI